MKNLTKKSQKEREAVVYVGPDMPNDMCKKYTIFEHGAIPANIALLCLEIPALNALFVPVSNLHLAKMQLCTRGSHYSVCYTRALEAIKIYQKKENR